MIAYKGSPKITTVVLHHTAVSRAVQPTQRASVNSYHKQKWNSPSELNGSCVGYNFFCEATGERTQERYVGEETIAQIGNNCDSPARCGMVSYCMAGDFRVEKPTTMQIADFRAFVDEVRSKYPNVVVKQHKDVASNRTCAELPDAEVQGWFEDELSQLKRENAQLKGLVVTLINIITKK